MAGLAFVYGTLLGSFLNVCVYRLPRGMSIVLPGSACTVCKEPIRWWQNIPIISYLILLGKCRSCGSSIALRYLLIELLTGILTAFVWWHDQGRILDFAFHLIFVSLLLVMTLIDLDFQIVLDSTIYIGIASGLLYNGISHHFTDAFLAGLAGALFFYSVRVVGEFVFLKEAMGMGDVEIAALLGACLGLQKMALAFFLSFPIGLLMAGCLILARLKSRKDYIPFGPAMALGGFISMFFSAPLINGYIQRPF